MSASLKPTEMDHLIRAMTRQTIAIERLVEAINGMMGAFLSDMNAPDDAEDLPAPPKQPYLSAEDG